MSQQDSEGQGVTAREIKALLKVKGWKIKEVGERWGLGARRMSQIVTDEARNQYYTDGFKGLPDKTEEK